MFATQKGRSNPVRISCKRSEKLKSGSLRTAVSLQLYLAILLRNSSAESLETRITFWRLVWPEAMVTEERGTFKRFAKNSMQASLARPSTGGEVKESLRAVPSSPVMAFFLARGWTFTANVTPPDVPCTANIRSHHRGTETQRKAKSYGSAFLGVSVPLWLSSFPFSEDRRAHAHAGRSLFNRDFKIVRHAHGKLVHGDGGQFTGGDRIPQLAQLAEVWPRTLEIVGERRHGHQSAEDQRVQAGRGEQQFFERGRAWRNAVFCSLAADVDFDEDIELPA